MREQTNISDNESIPSVTSQFLVFFLSIALLFSLLVTALQYHIHALTKENLLAIQRHNINLAADALRRDFATLSADLRTLAASHSLRRFATEPSDPNQIWAEDELAAFIRYKQLYAGISYVAATGQRLLAVGDPHPAHHSGAIARELVQQLLASAESSRFLSVTASPLLLSPQPVIDFVTPVVDLHDLAQGALIATYSQPRLLEHLGNILKHKTNVGILVNPRGDWLHYTTAEPGWVRAQDAPLGEVYSAAWRRMLAADSGQFSTSEGLFTFTTVYLGEQADPINPDPPPLWKIASRVDTDTLTAAVADRFRQGMLLYLLLLVPAAIIALYLAKLRTARLYNQERIRELGAVIEQTHDIVIITDANGTVRYVNPRFEEISGYGRDEIIGRKPSLLKSGIHEPAFYQRLWNTIQSGKPFEATVTNRKKDGQLFHVQMTISPLTNKRGITGFVATAKDITGQVSSQERLLMLAFHHPLTGLPNRALFRDHLHEAAARARRSEHSIAVLFIDLDRFKKVNDSLGHQVGDILLKEVAQRLRSAVREIDTVAHLGGDEFILLLDAIQQPAQVQVVATKLLQLFEQPFIVAERELHISASIGISMFPEDSSLGENDNVELLIEQADTAMYQAKRAGRGQFQFYSAEMTTLANERLELENRLRTALQQQEFELHFQPIVDPLRRELRGLEALIRWRQPNGELRGPDEFISVLEETGLVIPTTEWVLEEACRQCRRLHATGMTRIRMNVNISARSFYQGNLVRMVGTALQRTGMPPTQLVLEVTESVLLEDQYHIKSSLEQLRELGVGIAIDDFGTGYSSLSYLRRLPVDTIKIDRSFIHGVGPDSRDAALVSAMMAMAQELQLDVVAEGVEQTHQLDFLRQRGCDGAQGFLFSGPLPAKLINDWLNRDRNWPWKAWMDRGEAWRLH